MIGFLNVSEILTLLKAVKEECNACWGGVKVWIGAPGTPVAPGAPVALGALVAPGAPGAPVAPGSSVALGACSTPPSWFVRGAHDWGNCLVKRLGIWSSPISGNWDEKSPPSWKQVSGEISKLRSATELSPSAQATKELWWWKLIAECLWQVLSE